MPYLTKRTAQYSVRLPHKVIARLRLLGEQHSLSASELIREGIYRIFAVYEQLDKHEKPNQANKIDF